MGGRGARHGGQQQAQGGAGPEYAPETGSQVRVLSNRGIAIWHNTNMTNGLPVGCIIAGGPRRFAWIFLVYNETTRRACRSGPSPAHCCLTRRSMADTIPQPPSTEQTAPA